MINFYINDDPNKHICEVQLVHNMMMTARKGLPGHAVYNRVRNANEFLLVLPKEQPQDKEELQAWLIEYHAGEHSGLISGFSTKQSFTATPGDFRASCTKGIIRASK